MSVASSDFAVQKSLCLPLGRIGEIPCDVFLGCIAFAPESVRDQLIRAWSSQLVSVNKGGVRAAA